MRTIAIAAILCLAGLLAAPTAPAQNPDDMNICLCVNALARIFCKSPADIELIGKYPGTTDYSFSLFYANRQQRFVCGVRGDAVRIKGKAGEPMFRTIPYVFDPAAKCGTMSLSEPECPHYKPVVCCARKTKEDLDREKEFEFWNRPVPEILREELDKDVPEEQEGGQDPAAGETN